MKKIYFLVFLLWQATTIAQDTTGYDLLAHYPFQTDAEDATGNNADANIVNAPFQNGGIYSNGTYNDGSAGNTGSDIAMNGINNFNPDDFIITFEAKLSSNNYRYIFVAGMGYRWINIMSDYSNLLRVEYLTGSNGDFGYHTSNFSLLTDQWYQFGIKYSQSDHNLYIYVDNNLVDTINVPNGFTTNNEIYFSNSHGGYGIAFHGYWKNLKYFIPHNINGITENLQEYLSISQDRNEKRLYMDVKKGKQISLQIYDLSGKMIKKNQLRKGNNIIDMNQFSSGIYIAKIRVNQQVFNKKFTLQ